MSEQVTPGAERDELASVLHENFNKARGRGGVSPVLLADAILAAGFRRVSPVTREALIRAIRVPVRWQGETPEEYMLDEDDAGMVADAIMPLLSASPPAEDLAKPIERPGVTVNQSLGELLSASGSEAEESWQARMQDISDAEGRAFRAWANRDLRKIGQIEGFVAGQRASAVPAAEVEEEYATKRVDGRLTNYPNEREALEMVSMFAGELTLWRRSLAYGPWVPVTPGEGKGQ